jgi:hypothetical protein
VTESGAELYLRLAGERALLDPGAGQDPSEHAALDAAAHTLVAVGAMTAGAAQAIVDDYDLACAYRTAEQHRHHRALRRAARQAATPVPGLPALRAVPCHRLIKQPWGELILRYVVLSDEATALHVTMRPVLPPEGPSRLAAHRGRLAGRGPRPRGAGGHRIGPGLPGRLTVADDRGTTSTASFSGGGSDSAWHGEFQARPPLAPETAWIDVYGERIPGRPAPGGRSRRLAPSWGHLSPSCSAGPQPADGAAGLAGPVTIGGRPAGWPLLLAWTRGPGPAGQCRRARRACLRAHRAQDGMVPATVTAGMPSNQ